MSKEEKRLLLSRKKFITGTGVSLAGIALLGGAGTLLSGCAPEEPVNNDVAAPSYPFQYVKLDPERVAEIAYESYKAGNG